MNGQGCEQKDLPHCFVPSTAVVTEEGECTNVVLRPSIYHKNKILHFLSERVNLKTLSKESVNQELDYFQSASREQRLLSLLD